MANELATSSAAAGGRAERGGNGMVSFVLGIALVLSLGMALPRLHGSPPRGDALETRLSAQMEKARAEHSCSAASRLDAYVTLDPAGRHLSAKSLTLIQQMKELQPQKLRECCEARVSRVVERVRQTHDKNSGRGTLAAAYGQIVTQLRAEENKLPTFSSCGGDEAFEQLQAASIAAGALKSPAAVDWRVYARLLDARARDKSALHSVLFDAQQESLLMNVCLEGGGNAVRAAVALREAVQARSALRDVELCADKSSAPISESALRELRALKQEVAALD